MKLAYVDMENVIELDYRKATEWIIESPALFQKYVHLLNLQVEGEEGGFVLSDDDIILDISKYVEIVVNPFALDFEDRRIQKKLYLQLQKTAYGEEMFIDTQKLNADLQSYIFRLESICGYDIEIDTAMDVQQLFKALGVKMEGGEYDFSEKLAQYMKLMSELMGKKVLVFINIRSYLENEQIQELIKNANALVTYMEQNILPDYDNFVCAGAQYNDDAVYINEVVEKFHQMAADLKQRTESVMEYISQIQRAVEEGSEGINLAAKNTATLSEEISHISSQIMHNKKIADVLSEEAEHFI